MHYKTRQTVLRVIRGNVRYPDLKGHGLPKLETQVGYNFKAAARDSSSLEKSLNVQEIIVSRKVFLTSK